MATDRQLRTTRVVRDMARPTTETMPIEAIHRAVRATRIVTDHEDVPLVAAGSVASWVDLVMGSCT